MMRIVDCSCHIGRQVHEEECDWSCHSKFMMRNVGWSYHISRQVRKEEDGTGHTILVDKFMKRKVGAGHAIMVDKLK